jgi:hypothetical protein
LESKKKKRERRKRNYRKENRKKLIFLVGFRKIMAAVIAQLTRSARYKNTIDSKICRRVLKTKYMYVHKKAFCQDF